MINTVKNTTRFISVGVEIAKMRQEATHNGMTTVYT